MPNNAEDLRETASSAASCKVVSIATMSTNRNDVDAAAVLALNDDTDDEEDDVNDVFLLLRNICL